jgi:hypothetical protein
VLDQSSVGSQIPVEWTDVTPAWMTAALAGHHPDAPGSSRRRADCSTSLGSSPVAFRCLSTIRSSVAHGLATWLATAADDGGWQRPEISMALAQRYAAAFVELDTASALEELT